MKYMEIQLWRLGNVFETAGATEEEVEEIINDRFHVTSMLLQLRQAKRLEQPPVDGAEIRRFLKSME